MKAPSMCRTAAKKLERSRPYPIRHRSNSDIRAKKPKSKSKLRVTWQEESQAEGPKQKAVI
jgi:hypothetical protein